MTAEICKDIGHLFQAFSQNYKEDHSIFPIREDTSEIQRL